MTSITSAQMKAAFKIMQDFAPAIMKASEILEAVEQADSKLADHAKSMASIDETYADTVRQHEAAQVELRAIKTKLDQARAETAKERDALTASLADLKSQVTLVKQAIDETRKTHANVLAEQKQELDAVNGVLEQKRKELADFRRAIPKTY